MEAVLDGAQPAQKSSGASVVQRWYDMDVEAVFLACRILKEESAHNARLNATRQDSLTAVESISEHLGATASIQGKSAGLTERLATDIIL